jgi:hypothetical protein
MSLFRTNEKYKDIINTIYEAEGELTEDIQAQLALTLDDRDNKSIAYRETISDINAQNEQISEEIKRLQALKNRNLNVVTALNKSLLKSVQLFGKYKVGTVSFSSRKSQRVEVSKDVIDILPDEFKVITATPNKKTIKDALKSGDTINGCELIDCESISIK